MNPTSLAIDPVKSAVSWLQDTTARRAIVAQAREAEAEKQRQRRRTLLAERETLEARELALIRAHEPKRKAAEAALEQARANLTSAESQLAQLAGRHREELWPVSHWRDRIAAELYETRPAEAIAEFVGEMEQELEATYRSKDSVREMCIDGVRRTQWHNNESLRLRAEAITEAIREARTLWQVVIDEADLAPRLDALRASLPTIEERPRKYYLGGDDAA